MAEFHPLRSTLDDEIPLEWKEANQKAEETKLPCISLCENLDHLSSKDDIYDPAEDTFLLIDAVCHDLAQNIDSSNVRVCLEIGCGSGVVLEAVTRQQQQHHQVSKSKDQSPSSPPQPLQFIPLATDLNLQALQCTKKTNSAQLHCGTVLCDLASAIRTSSIDLLLFNPPYVPTPDAEVHDPAAWAWAGGANGGRRVIDRWMRGDLPRVLKRPHGVAYVVTVDENRPSDMAEELRREYGMWMRPIGRRRAKNEYLSVHKITFL